MKRSLETFVQHSTDLTNVAQIILIIYLKKLKSNNKSKKTIFVKLLIGTKLSFATDFNQNMVHFLYVLYNVDACSRTNVEFWLKVSSSMRSATLVLCVNFDQIFFTRFSDFLNEQESQTIFQQLR